MKVRLMIILYIFSFSCVYSKSSNIVNGSSSERYAEFSPDYVKVSDFGAIGDGKIDDAPAIRKAVLYARDNKINKIVFDNKTYLLNSTENTVFIPVFSNMEFIGQQGTVLKQGNGQLKNQDAKVFFSQSLIENVIFRDFTIDLNGENNLGEFIVKRMNIAIGATNAKNILIKNMKFLNNAGRQTIMIGKNSLKKTASNISVINSEFKNMGNSVRGNYNQTDHSSIYVVADGFTAKNNRFINRLDTKYISVCTAIESQSDNAIVENNMVNNYKNMFVIAAVISTQYNSKFLNNYGENVLRIAEFWTRANMNMDDIIIQNNTIKQHFPCEAISIFTQVRGEIGTVQIIDNSTEFIGKRSNKYSFPSIYSTLVKNLVIKNNIFKNIPSGAFQNFASSKVNQSINFSNNKIINCGNTNSNMSIQHKTAVLLNGVSGNKLSILNNTFLNDNDTFCNQAIIIDNRWNTLDINNNSYQNFTKKVINKKNVL